MLQNAVFLWWHTEKAFSFWGCCPQSLPGALPLDPTGGLLRPPDPRIIFLLFHFSSVPCPIHVTNLSSQSSLPSCRPQGQSCQDPETSPVQAPAQITVPVLWAADWRQLQWIHRTELVSIVVLHLHQHLTNNTIHDKSQHLCTTKHCN